MQEEKLTVQKFVQLPARKRTAMLSGAPIEIELRTAGPVNSESKIIRKIAITATERDNDAISITAAIAYQGFNKLMPNESDTVVLNDPSTKDKSFKFAWV